MVTKQIRVSGRVQGVGFREAMIAQAQRAGVTGWVRNRAEGTVEAIVQGPEAAVEALIAWAGRGPPMARVDALHAGAPDAEFARDYATFERWPSL